MALNAKHKFTCNVPDGDDTTVVRPSNWNDDHTLEGFAAVAETGSYTDLVDVPTELMKTNAAQTMTASLVSQSDSTTGAAAKQTRNIIFSTDNPSGGSNGDVWIKYTA